MTATVSMLLGWLLAVLPLQTVHVPRGNGYAASVLSAVMAIGLLAIVAKFATTKPKNRRRPPHR